MAEVEEKHFHVWSDGSCRVGSDKMGSWAYIIVNHHDEIIHSDMGIALNTTAPTMELTAVVNAVSYITHELPHGEVTVHSDCELVIKGISEWISKWKNNNWKTAAGTSVKNKDLWDHLDHLTSVVDVKFNWVRGHNGIKYNEMAHDMAFTLLNAK